MSGKEVGVDGPVEIHRELNRRVGHARGTSYSADQEVRISSILHSTQGKEVTDARDRIFALHGIFSALGLNISPPDYSKDLVQVFSETTARAIEEDKSLSVLNHIVGQSQTSKLPSWVPDWNEKSPAWSPLNFFFRPAKDSPLVFEFIQQDRRLCLWGVTIDTIKTCTPTLEVSSFMDNAPIDGESLIAGVRAGIELMKIVLQWIELGLSSKFRKKHEETFLALLQELLYTDLAVDEYADDFSRWLMIFLWKREMREGDTYINLFSRWLIKTVTGEEPEPNPEPDIQPEGPQLTESVSPPREQTPRPAVKHPVDPQTAAWADFYELGNNDFFAEAVKTREFAQFNLLSDNDSVKRFQDYFLRVNRARRLFDTENGRSGTGSAVVQPGDQVVLFSGSRQPMMVRKDATEMYRLLGPAYVDGIMDGQAWGSTWGPENGLEKFILV